MPPPAFKIMKVITKKLKTDEKQRIWSDEFRGIKLQKY